MALTPPATLSPSKVSSFSSCPLSFRYSAIDRLPEKPSVAAVKGTAVHLALEYLLCRPAGERSPEAAHEDLDRALAEMAGTPATADGIDRPDSADETDGTDRADPVDLAGSGLGQATGDPEYRGLDLDEAAAAAFAADAHRLVDKYFTVENPADIHPIGLELRLEAQVGDLRVRGIIDRLELDEDGGFVVTDYKTGRAPGTAHQQGRLGGVVFYSLLCQELFGVLPSKIQLIYLGDGLTITTEPTEQSLRGLRTKLGALWQAIERACEKDDFRPRTGPLCNYCGFHAYCPAQGGDPALAAAFVAQRDAADATSRDAASAPAETPTAAPT